MASIIGQGDLPAALQSAEMIYVMIAGANANAARVAPCLADTTTPPTADQLAEAQLVLIGALTRWVEAGSGAVVQQQAGPFGQTIDTRQRTGYHLWPSEIERLQDICKAAGDSGRGAFSVTPAGGTYTHAAWCSLAFGATYCSCGSDIAGYPIFEVP